MCCITMKNLWYGGVGRANNIDDVFTMQGAYVDLKGHRSPQAGCSVLDWSRIAACLPKTRWLARANYPGPADLGRIKASIDAGHPVTLEVRWLGRATAMHFVEGIGYEGNDIIVNCPELGRQTRFSSGQYGTGNSATDILTAHFFTGPVPAGRGSAPAAPVAQPKEEEVTQAQHDAAIAALQTQSAQQIAAISAENQDIKAQIQQATDLIGKQADTINRLQDELSKHVPEYEATETDFVGSFIINETFDVTDVSDQAKPVEQEAGTIVDAVKRFTVYGEVHFRTQKSVDAGLWYAFPLSNLTPHDAAGETPVLDLKAKQAALNATQKIHAAAADGLSGWKKLLRIFNPVKGN